MSVQSLWNKVLKWEKIQENNSLGWFKKTKQKKTGQRDSEYYTK